MRLAAGLAVILTVACSGPVASHGAASQARVYPSVPSSSVGPLTTGGIVEYAVPNPKTYPASCPAPCPPSLGTIALGPDGNIWFVDVNRQQVGRITPHGQILQFPLPNPPIGGAQTIARGPDGNMWLTARGEGQGENDWILRVTPDGNVSRFPAGTGVNTAPESIAMGPDGNLWFTEVFGNRIGRITPSGQVTEFPISGWNGPRGITEGPDGALWFTLSTGVGRVTTDGAMTFYPVSNDPALPLGDIVSGPNGELWFLSYQGMWHLSARAPVALPVPLPGGAHTWGLVVGPDRNIWFTDNGLNAVARLTIGAGIREFSIPTRVAAPLGIAVGSDGRIWFTESSGGRLASIGVRVAEATLSGRAVVLSGSLAKNLTVTNSGDGVMNIETARLGGPDSAAFAIKEDRCTNRSLNPGAGCVVSLAYIGGAAGGVRAAQLVLTDNASGSPQRVSLVSGLRPCRLPVTVPEQNGTPVGEFLDTATGHIVDQPGGGFEAIGPASGVRTTTQPILNGPTAGYYDRPYSRWLPVYSADMVSPDGSHYVYTTRGPEDTVAEQLHVVDVLTGRDHELSLPQGFWVVVSFSSQGIYMHQAYEGIGPGLWIADPEWGAFRQVLSDGTVMGVTGTTAWLATWNSADMLPQPPGIGGGHNEISSRDLTTGASTTWFYRPGTNDYVAAVINGKPIVVAYDGITDTYFFVAAPDQPQRIQMTFSSDTAPAISGFVADPDGFWVGSLDGVYFWTAGTGGILVSDLAAAAPAGTCA